MKLPAWVALSQVDLTGYPHTTCIHLIACSVDGRSYTLLACLRIFFAFLYGGRGRHWPLHCCSCPRPGDGSSQVPLHPYGSQHRS